MAKANGTPKTKAPAFSRVHLGTRKPAKAEGKTAAERNAARRQASDAQRIERLEQVVVELIHRVAPDHPAALVEVLEGGPFEVETEADETVE